MEPESTEPRWEPLPAIHRRILGVLVEKAKTTPDNYPLSLNSLTSGCNQKSNRDPQMDLDADDIEEALQTLREKGACNEVHGDGRVVRYRHYMKDWLGVDATELAVMAELMLRGTQTLGELRGRAARMAAGKLPDLGSLKPVLQSLIEKKLVIAVTPAGRGQLVTHGLYTQPEMDRILRDRSSAAAAPQPSTSPAAVRPAAPQPSSSAPSSSDEVARLRQEVAQMREELARVKKDVADLWSSLQ